MKPQDIVLLLILVFFLWRNNKNWTVIAGILLLVFAMPLFAKHVFFTAQHSVYFAALYFLVAIGQITVKLVKSSK